MATEIQYTPVNWVNSPSTYTPISAGNLNKMEKGISDCVTAINDLSAFFTFRGSIATDEDIEDIPNTEKQNGYVYVIQSDSVAIAWSDKENDWVSLGRLEIPDLSDVVSEEDFEELKDKVTVAYIVETGTSGIWTYRKWSDGTAECWGTAELKNQTFTDTWGSLYECSNSFPSVDYPLEFSNIPVETVNVASSAPAVFIYTGANDGRNTATKCGRYLAVRASQYATPSDVWCNYYVIGRWDDEN